MKNGEKNKRKKWQKMNLKCKKANLKIFCLEKIFEKGKANCKQLRSEKRSLIFFSSKRSERVKLL